MNTNRKPWIIFANVVNELMIEIPTMRYAKAMSAITPRKMWIANENDLIVTPVPIDPVFKKYVAKTIGINPDKVKTLTPKGELTDLLAHRVRMDDTFEKMGDYVKHHRDASLLPFASDRPTLSLAWEVGSPIWGYKEFPSRELMEAFYDINTKSGFRKLMHKLGIPTVKGCFCSGLQDLAANVEKLLCSSDKVIIKFDRSSNGYGHVIIGKEDIKNTTVLALLEKNLSCYSSQPFRFIVEQFVNFTALPSVEIEVTEQGPHILYICDQRCPGAAYSGMVTPPNTIDHNQQNRLSDVGLRFGNYLHSLGFRGICDVDCCLDDQGQFFATESNFRRTAGTFIDYLARRLVDPDYYPHTCWVQDAAVANGDITFESVLEYIENENIAFNPETKTGVLIHSNTIHLDNKIRYIIFSNLLEEAFDIEKRFLKMEGAVLHQ